MLFDTHAHYDDRQFDGDRDQLLSSMHKGGVGWIVNNGTTADNSEFSAKLAEKYGFMYFAAGIHPEEVETYSTSALDRVVKLLSHEKNVAVGEVGLDYHWVSDNKPLQQEVLRTQLEIARAHKKPVVIHERDACKDMLEIVADYTDVMMVFHCFSGSWETAKTLLSRGWYLSFNGVVTFKNARKALEVVQKMPRDRLMLETDCPYLAPTPFRGKRNSSLYLPYTAAKIAQLWGVEPAEAEAVTTQNAFRFFGIQG